MTSGGTIPDNADYSVLLEPQGLSIGSVNEDFAVESIAGDVFQLGNTSYRILRVESGKVRVEDAQGMPPTIPFWLGEAPGRSDELSAAVARLQAQLDELLSASPGNLQPALDWLTTTLGLNLASAEQLVEYLARARQTLGALPSQDTLLMERFFGRVRRHPTDHSHAVRQPHQPRLGPGLAQAFLPHLQLRVAGRRQRRRDRAVAVQPATASSSTKSGVTCTATAPNTPLFKRCLMRRCSACAGAGMPEWRWRCRASPAGAKSLRNCNG